MKDLEVKLQYNIATDNEELFLFRRVYWKLNHGVYFAQPLEFKKREPNAQEPPRPLLGGTRASQDDGVDVSAKQFLQAMLEEAWNIGLRPVGFQDHTNELTAVRYHLEDMRQLAKLERKTK